MKNPKKIMKQYNECIRHNRCTRRCPYYDECKEIITKIRKLVTWEAIEDDSKRSSGTKD